MWRRHKLRRRAWPQRAKSKLIRSSPRKRGPSSWPWIPAYAGMSGACFESLACELPLLHALARLFLGVRAHDLLDLQGRHAGFCADVAVLRLDHRARRLVPVESAEQLGRHLAVGALCAVLIDDVEQHVFAAGARSWFTSDVLVPP